MPVELPATVVDPTAAAREWKATGGRVVGYFADDVPVALVEAAGFLAYRISGNPRAGQAKIMARGPVDVRADRLEYTHSWVHRIERGDFDFVDYFLITNSRKHILQLVERLRGIDVRQPIHILDRALGRGYAASQYNYRQVVKFKRQLESWSGRPIADDALVSAVGSLNERAHLLGRLAKLRRQPGPQIGGVDALRLLRAARWHRSEQYNAVVGPLLDRLAQLPSMIRPRVFVAGSPIDADDVYELIEACGSIVVDESHGWGGRILEQAIPSGRPLDAVATHFHRHADFVYPLVELARATARRVEASQAQAAIFYVFEFDDATLWEAPTERAALAVPSLAVTEAPYLAQPERITADISGFIARIAS